MNIEQKAVREKLAEAGKKFDGHVTHGSLNEQMEVVLAALQSAVAEEREECAKIADDMDDLGGIGKAIRGQKA